MPNYRNKNRNRNKNKQRNKQQQQQQQQQKNQTENTNTAPTNREKSPTATPTPPNTALQTKANEVINASAIALENKNVNEITETAAEESASAAAIIEKVPADVTIVSTAPAIATTTASTNDTVFNEPSVCENINESEINYAVNIDQHNMGNEKSKLNDPDKCPEAPLTPPTNSPLVGKVIVHRIVCEDTNTSKTNKETSTTANELATPTEEIVQTEHSQAESKSKVIVHKVLTSESASESGESKTQVITKETRQAAAASRAPVAVQSPQKVKKQRRDTKQLIKPEEEPFKVLIHKILTTTEEETQQPDANKASVIHKNEKDCNETGKTDTQGQEHKVALQDTVTQVTASQKIEQEKPHSKVIVHQVAVEGNQSQVAVSSKTEVPKNTQKEVTNASKTTDPEQQQPKSPDKVIVHQVAVEGNQSLDAASPQAEGSENTQKDKTNPMELEQHQQQSLDKVIPQDNQSSDVLEHETKVSSTSGTQQQQETSPKVIVHKVAIQDSRKESESESVAKQEEPSRKVTVHKVNLALEENENDADDSSSQSDTTETANQHQVKVIVHQIHVENRDDDVLEQQPQITSPIMKENLAERQKFSNSDVRIVEISDGSHSDLEELRSPVVSEAESSLENSDDLQKVAESITEICTTTTCSSSSASASQKQTTRKQKRMALESHFMPQIMNPRFLDSISEENSELSDNSDNPLSRSASTDSATNCSSEAKVQKLNAKFPKSSLDFTKSHKQHHTHRKSKVIREEPIAMAVSAHLHDAPDAEADESCTTLRSCMSPEAEAAEVVFINSASSSMSDLHDLELYDNVNINTSMLGNDMAKDVNNGMTENICSTSLTLTSSPIERKTQKLPEFDEIETININARDVNNYFPFQPLANEIKTDSPDSFKFSTTLSSSPSPLPSSASLPANEHLVFAQIEEQISSVLSSINEAAATQNTSKTILANTKTTTTTTTTATTSTTSNTSSMKIHTNLLNTQNLPVTTTSTLSITTQTTATAIATPPTPTASSSSQLASRTLETSCESFNTDSSSLCADNNAKTTRLVYKHNNVENMNTVRDLITNNGNNNSRNISESGEMSLKLNGNHENSETVNGCYIPHTYSNNTFTPINPQPRGSPPPPPIPPPPSQEILPEYAFATTTTTTNASLPLLQKNVDNHNFQTQNNSLNQPSSSSPSLMKRQESLESHCSDSTNISQCTAINVANEQSTSDFVKTTTSSISDLKLNTQSTPTPTSTTSQSEISGDPKKLRFLCAETVASLPYGGEVLQELASVAQNIGEARAVQAVKSVDNTNMPYPLPQLPHIDDLQLSLKVKRTNNVQSMPQQKPDQSWLGVPTTNDPTVLVCLSPSQRSYIQQKPEQKPDDLLDAHQKFMERRGYHEYTKEQLEFMEKEKLAEQQLLQTAAMMKKLRKSITPPPPQIPPPPVPVKSSETATIAQNLSKRTVNTQKSNDDANQNQNQNENRSKEQTQAFANGVENNGDENKHRLLSIINDSSESTSTSASASSHENNSRQTTNGHSVPVAIQVVTETSTLDNNTSKSSYKFPQLSPQPKTLGTMQSVETTLGQMFPTMGSSNIFDQEHKRFSNIESSTAEPFCNQLLNAQPKRYSSVETHFYETKKRCENGQVVQDFSTSKHESKTLGDKSESSFPLKIPTNNNNFFRSGTEQQPEREICDKPKAQNNSDDQEIMSALKLNKQTPSLSLPLSDIQTKIEKQAKTLESETTIKTTTIEEEKRTKKIENAYDEHREESEKESTVKRGTQDSYEEFRQRAKAAADAAFPLPTLNLSSTAAAPQSVTAKVTSNGDIGDDVFSSTLTSQTTRTQEKKSSTLSYDHQKLFKEFDDLSKQLHRELETSKAEREQREKSASMFDLNRVHMRQKQQIEEYNKSRHEHLKELEQQIERSMRSRSLLFNKSPEAPSNTDTVDHQSGRTYEIPIQIENGYTTNSKAAGTSEEAPPVPAPPKTYNIPIQQENSVDDSRFRRAESMFNLSDDMQQRRRTCSNQSQFLRTEDDWSKYASDLGSSENIVRPFAKEVEICYQRRPGGIRAPRLTASTNDLSLNNQHSYDQYNAYNVRRHHAPMLSRAPEPPRPKFGSCYSMIERDPNPKYISTTTRRGVSPAPQPSGYFSLDGCHVREEDIRQRRASLPREIHEQQLKYITSKEEELRTEFERLQNERRRLMEEAQKAQAMQMPQTPTSPMTPTRPLRDPFRSTQKLPTLTEDEVFRQQMAEEWLNKVAERENRRLQNIIKISKIHEDETTAKHKADMEQEFLSRVKERRHKLAMPADSDWESGAESQPTKQAQHSEGEEVPPVKIIEGEREANLRRLPRHLREFAKFSNHQKENIEGGHREEHQEEERSEETTDNSMCRAVKKSTVVKTVKTLRAPMLTTTAANGVHGHDTAQSNQKPSGHHIPVRPKDPYLTDRGQRKCHKQTRFAVNTNRRSWSESDLLQEIEKDLNLAKGFLFQDEKAQSPSMFAPKFKAKAPSGSGIWSPKNQTPSSSLSDLNKSTPPTPPPPPLQPVWTPQPSPQSNRKEFRPVHFESPTLPRKYVLSTSAEPALPPWNDDSLANESTNFNQRKPSHYNGSSSSSIAADFPKSSISEKIKTFERSASASELYSRPQIKRLADKGRPLCKPNEVIYNVKHEYMSEPETDKEHPRKMAQLVRRQYDGIGPMTNDGMPIILRSEVKEPHQHEWYKRLYQTIHKQKHGDECIIRYKQPRGRNLYNNKPNGYQSEPEPNYDSDYSTIKYRTVNPNRLQSVSSALNLRKSNDTLYGTLPNPVKSGQNSYKNQPGRIEDYVTGHSSVSEKEKKEQLDQAKLSTNYTEGNLSRALAKESGYTSDSNLVFRKKEIPQSSPLSPVEQKQAYKNVQAGGEPPLFGFRKPAPEKSKALETKKDKDKKEPPEPPNRKSLYTKSMAIKKSKGIPLPSSSSSRHEKCFKSPDSPVLGLPSKFATLTLRKTTTHKGPLCRSKSAGAVSTATLPSEEKTRLITRKQAQMRCTSPLRKSLTSRHTSRSPVAFGRSISKERTFAEEKKRLENSLPLSRYTFEASTNILRDPALKSPQDVKKAVRTLASCAVQSRSRSVPRFCTGCRSQAILHNNQQQIYAQTIGLPEISHYGYTEWVRQPVDVSRIERKRKVLKSQSAKQLAKTNSNVSLAASNSTFSLGQSSPKISAPKAVNAKSSVKPSGISKVCKKLTKDKTKPKKSSVPSKVEKPKEAVKVSTYVSERKYTPTSRSPSRKPDNLVFEETYDNCLSSVRDRTDFWNDFNMQQTVSLPYTGPKRPLLPYTANVTAGHKSRSLSPKRNRLTSDESNQNLTGDSGYTETPEASVKKEEKEFSPTREVRVPPYQTAARNVRSPSRRKIDSCRSNQTNKVIRASSLSSAEDRSQRGLYLCDELAHSATSLASSDRHSPTCRYLHNSERFAELSRFYALLERKGQLEKCTSKTNFKPIRKESDLLDYEEWRQVRLHERAEKELNFLVEKLKKEQQAQKFLFLPKDVNEVKWRKECDIGLNSREKSVEDLRENFESINFLQDYAEQRNKATCCHMKYWRRNTVADLTHSLEEKCQKDALGERENSPLQESHFSEQLVKTLPQEQLTKINQQLNDIYSSEPHTNAASKAPGEDEQYVVTVEHSNMPCSSQALRVRCKSSITRDELLGSILKKKNALNKINLKKHDKANEEELVKASSQKKKEEEPPEIPPAPIMPTEEPTRSTQDHKDIMEKIKYFEQRKFETPPKTIYRPREDSSPDEDEVMRVIEEKMRLKQYREQRQHKELSSSLTDLCGIFGERNSMRVNFHRLSPQQRPPDESQADDDDDDSAIYQHSEDYTPYSSLEFLETYCRSRSASPQSQCSSYLQRVNTGEVQKIREKFESLGYEEHNKSNSFFGLSKLRKVRSDPEMNTLKSESKDAEVSWITHKFEMQNKLLKPIKEEQEPRRGLKRLVRSPIPPLGNRLMPHIDRISKTAALGQLTSNKRECRSQSPTRSLSSNSGIVERLKVRYEAPTEHFDTRSQMSQSSPDIRDIKDCIPQYLTANWIAHRYPSPTHNHLGDHNKANHIKKVSNCPHTSMKTKLPNCKLHGKPKDIFANQKFDPKIHTPKARYVPEGAETYKQLPRLQWSPLTSKRVQGNAVTFQDYDFPKPQLPPPPKGELLEQLAAVSPNRYYESDVNIHFKTPVRQEFKYPLSEEELAIRQAEQMQKLYREERRRKYLQELQDMNSRRHTDNFTPSQKSPIPLNRYDDFPADLAPKTGLNQVKSVARALYNFQAQNSKELSFKKGDIIYIRRAIDKNWYEGEHNAMIGLFPANYVEIINKETTYPVQIQSTAYRKPSEGQARAKYNFQAQSAVELSLNKGELVALTRRVDDNWFEGRIANRKGIFPVSYVEVLTDIGAEDIAARTTTIQNSRPTLDALRTNINNEFNTLTRNGNQPPNAILRETRNHKTDILHVDTSSEPLIYRALYKYLPQNSDELELQEGDIVHVLEKCDDGWYVGTSQRSGCFGTFPGNYVERV